MQQTLHKTHNHQNSQSNEKEQYKDNDQKNHLFQRTLKILLIIRLY